jgi:hypothetical protein
MEMLNQQIVKQHVGEPNFTMHPVSLPRILKMQAIKFWMDDYHDRWVSQQIKVSYFLLQ